MAGDIPLRPLGATGEMVSALGLGGYHLGRIPSVRDAVRIIHAAIDAGITFMDNAWEYHAAESRDADGPGARGSPRSRVPDDQGLHARPRHARGDAPARRVAAAPARPTTSISGRSTSASTTTTPSVTSRAGGVIEALDRGEAPGQGALRRVHRAQGSRHPPARCSLAAIRSTRASCRSTASTRRSGASSSAVLPELLRRGIAPIGMKSLGGDGQPGEEEGRHAPRRRCATR